MSTGAEPLPLPRSDAAQLNARALERHLAWLGAVLQARLASYFAHPGEHPDPRSLAPPRLDRLANGRRYALAPCHRRGDLRVGHLSGRAECRLQRRSPRSRYIG